jgi:hypothetical protein
MTISGGMNFNPTPTQAVYGSQVAQSAGQNREGIADVMTSSDLNAITQLGGNIHSYEGEASKPSLKTLLLGSPPQESDRSDAIKEQYKELYNQFSEDMKLELAGEPTVYTAALRYVMDLAAKAVDGQNQAAAAERDTQDQERNRALPKAVYQNSLEIGKELANQIEAWIKKGGANDPNYLEGTEFVATLKTLLKGTSYGN